MSEIRQRAAEAAVTGWRSRSEYATLTAHMGPCTHRGPLSAEHNEDSESTGGAARLPCADTPYAVLIILYPLTLQSVRRDGAGRAA